MSCWRTLQLSHQPNDTHIPQLLVKPVFDVDSYTVYVTDLSDIWAEELHLEAIIDRASSEQSPIEVSKHDTAQLAILLENIQKALLGSHDAVCRITRGSRDGLTLHTSVGLPNPLGSLAWTHQLEKRTSVTLKNELVLPLLVSTHVQHERIADLISIIAGKDKAINRLLDQCDSSNLDLAAAFPSIGGLKAGRRTIKREQAAKHVPALHPFCEQPWRELTGRFKDSNVTTLMTLCREALVHSALEVPQKLMSEGCSETWWTALPDTMALLKPITSSIKSATAVPPHKLIMQTSEDETEDEFETHGNFTSRSHSARENDSAKVIITQPPMVTSDEQADVSTEEEEDLDDPPKSPGQSRSQYNDKQQASPRASPDLLKLEARVNTTASVLSPRETVPPSSQLGSPTHASPRKVRRHFKIGGKGKNISEGTLQQASTVSERMNSDRVIPLLPTEAPSSAPPQRLVKKETPTPEHDEETPEEKAERKRAELKRKNAEAAKKQAQQIKKKKRF